MSKSTAGELEPTFGPFRLLNPEGGSQKATLYSVAFWTHLVVVVVVVVISSLDSVQKSLRLS